MWRGEGWSLTLPSVTAAHSRLWLIMRWGLVLWLDSSVWCPEAFLLFWSEEPAPAERLPERTPPWLNEILHVSFERNAFHIHLGSLTGNQTQLNYWGDIWVSSWNSFKLKWTCWIDRMNWLLSVWLTKSNAWSYLNYKWTENLHDPMPETLVVFIEDLLTNEAKEGLSKNSCTFL